MKRSFGCMVAVTSLGLLAAGVPGAAADRGGGHHQPRERLTLVATGLDQPRHMDFSARGELYIAEAGSGGAVEPTGFFAAAEHCTGFTGAVSRLDNDGGLERVIDGLPSSAHCDDGSQGLGPHGVLALGRHDVVVQIGSPAIVDPNGGTINAGADQFGPLVRVDDDGGIERVIADITGFEQADPDGEGYDSNPVDVAGYRGGYVTVDAGGNAIHVIDGRGRLVRTILIPQDPCPGGAANCFGDANLDSVPTGITRGRGDTYYVSTLSGVVADFTVTPPDVNFRPGNGKVFAVNVATGQVAALATGLTTVIDVAYDRTTNSVYAAEFVTGAIHRIDVATGARTRVDQPGDLITPGGLAVDSHGNLYVSTFAAAPGHAGQVVRYNL